MTLALRGHAALAAVVAYYDEAIGQVARENAELRAANAALSARLAATLKRGDDPKDQQGPPGGEG